MTLVPFRAMERLMTEKPKQDDPAQSKRFIDTAREREADETEKGADKAFRRVISSRQEGPKSRS
jgi:hypothetical protein